MKQLFALAENEQRVVIAIVLLLVLAASVRHQRSATQSPLLPAPSPLSSPAAHLPADREQ